MPKLPRKRLIRSRSSPVPARDAAPASELFLVVDNAGAVAGLNLRGDPARRPGNILKVLPPGALLKVVEDVDAALGKLGRLEQWIQVADRAGGQGYVCAAYVRRSDAIFAEDEVIRVVVNGDVTSSGGLRLREAPNAAGTVVTLLPAGSELHALDTAAEVNARVGVNGQWLRVRDGQGREGYVAAWYTRIRVEVPLELVAQGVAVANVEAILRATPDSASPEVWRAAAGTPLRVTDEADWPSRVGVSGAFVRVTSYAFKTGYIAAEALSLPALDRRAAADNAHVPVGESAWLFGMHDPYDSSLHSNGRAGWVLFTEICNGAGSAAYEDWAKRDWGVIVRLNNDYGGSGTIPVTGQYAAFAECCANWVRNSQGCHLWIIGNEMNNPREWPN
ncbi:MAG: SH3 domain-containing protein, partial [Thermoflexales bacterium]